jgi:outer membrane autotransporter protein
MSKINTLPPARRFTSTRRDRRLRFAPSALVLALSSVLALPGAALAADWTGNVDNDWFVTGNWSTGAEPTAADDVFIDTGTSKISIINTNNAFANNVIVGVTPGATGVLVLGAGASLAGNNGMLGANAGSTGVVQLFGSSWTNSALLIVGNLGSGDLQIRSASTVSNTASVLGFMAGSSGKALVDGTGSAWNNSADLSVGGGGTGTLTISNGGAVTSVNGFVGNFGGSDGTVLVTGVGSSWTNTGDLSVGDLGKGKLDLKNGGTVTANDGFIGSQAGSAGQVSVDGAGSNWTSNGNLFVGESGRGSLAISGAGTVNSTIGIVGNSLGSDGSVTVSGNGSAWSNTGDLFVGLQGAATLVVLGGGDVGNAAATIGSDTDSVGKVTVDGTGSSWTSTGNLIVGEAGKGTLAISGGGVVGNTTSIVGKLAGSTGHVTVDGTGSTWTNGSHLQIGQMGTGSLSISGGGAVFNTFGFVGTDPGGAGAVTVDGIGSSWANSAELIVGNGGTGTLAVTGGATVTSASGVLAADGTGVGTATVGGPGSKWANTGDLVVGYNGVGTLVITNGGEVSNAMGSIGSASIASGSVTVDGAGSKWINTGNLLVGDDGKGALLVSNGATVSDVSGVIGNGAGSSGAMTVTGAGSSWVNSADFAVGNAGTGTLLVSSGGAVSTLETVLGSATGGTGTMTVDGAGSTLTSTSYISVGDSGTGTLAVRNGGTVSNGNGYVARNAGSAGTVLVDGAGSALANSGDMVVGVGGTAALAITNGGAVNNVNGTVGQVAGSTGTVLVDGAGSTWSNSGYLRVGDDSMGTLTIANGGNVTVSGLLSLGAQLGGTGTLNIGGAAGAAAAAPGTLTTAMVNFGDGGGMVNFNHTDNSANYAFDAVFAGAGTINQNAGWTKLTGDSSGFTGLTHVNGGRLAVNGSLAGSLVDVNNGGTLGGSGFVGGIQANAGGTVAPGNSIGTLNVMGNVTQAAGSVYEVELNAAGQSDLIKASGTATIQAGALLKPVNYGLAPLKVGTHYTVLQADGGVTGQYSLLGSSNFLSFAASYDATHVYLDVAQVKSFAEAGLTPNQKAAGAGAESLGSGLLYNAILMSPSDQAARIAFDQLSGEVHASARGVQLQDSHFVRDASLERLRAMDSERVANDGGADPEDGKPTRLLPSVRDLAYWARAMGSWGHTDGDGNAATVKRDTSGFLMGADTRFGEQGRFGLMGGYSRSAFDVSDRNSSGSSENYHLGAYAGSRFGDLALRTGVSYSWHDVSTSRAVAFPGFSDSLKADYKAATTQAFAELGYRIKTERAELEPFANLALVNVSSDGFTERGGPAALTSAGNSSGVTFSTVGLRASTSFAMDNGTSVTARGSLGWRNASGDVTPTTSLAFAGGLPFSVAGAPIAKSAAVVEAGLDFKLTNAATLGLSYGGQFGSGLKDHSARIQLNVAF